MAKFYGKIGYVIDSETSPGVHEEQELERVYSGDIISNRRRLRDTDNLNSDITVSVSISIIADPYATMNMNSIRYVEFNGAKWKVTDVEVLHPRLALTLGGVYNG